MSKPKRALRPPTVSRRVHDYRTRCWGHDYTLTPDPDPVTARVTGWGDGLRQHDLLVIAHPKGGSCFYEIEQIEYCRDPDDMWFARCRFVPGSSELGQKAAAALDGKRKLLELWWVLDG